MANPNGKKGSSFERLMADCFKKYVSKYIDRKVKTGVKDTGDLTNMETPGGGSPIVVECKNVAKTNLGGWANEAEVERQNHRDAIAGIVIHKRKGKGQALDQWVTMTVRDFIAILTDVRPD